MKSYEIWTFNELRNAFLVNDDPAAAPSNPMHTFENMRALTEEEQKERLRQQSEGTMNALADKS